MCWCKFCDVCRTRKINQLSFSKQLDLGHFGHLTGAVRMHSQGSHPRDGRRQELKALKKTTDKKQCSKTLHEKFQVFGVSSRCMLILIFSHVYIECLATTGLPISIPGSKGTSSKWDALRLNWMCMLVLNGCNWSWSGITVVKTCADFVRSHNAEAPGGTVSWKMEDLSLL